MKKIYSRQRQNKQTSIGFQGKASNIVTLETSCGWIILAKRAQGQSTRGHWAWKQKMFSRSCSAEDVDSRHTERLKINQEQVRYLQKRQSTNDSTSNGRSTRRTVRSFKSLYRCWSWLLWLVHCEDWAKKLKAMALSFHMSNYESRAYRSCTQVGHR